MTPLKSHTKSVSQITTSRVPFSFPAEDWVVLLNESWETNGKTVKEKARVREQSERGEDYTVC